MPTQSSTRGPAPIQRILIKEVNWLGDVIMSLPALFALRQAYPQAHLAVLIKQELAGLFDGLTWIDEVIPYSIRQGISGVGDRIALVRRLRRARFELAVLFPRSFEAALWAWLSRIPKRAGVIADGRGWMLTHAARTDTKNPARHQSLAWLEMLHGALGIAAATDPAPLLAAPQNRRAMQDWLAQRRQHGGPLIALAPAAAYGPAKEWAAESYAVLIDRLAVDGFECLLVGAPSERQRCADIAAATRSGALVAAGETSIGELIALLSLCEAFVGNDSGAMHLAAALGVATVAIFGSTNPTRTGPLGSRTRVLYEPPPCSPCLARTCRFGHYECLTRIAPDTVLAALAELR